MQLPDEIAQLGAGGWLGFAAAVVTGGAFAIRRIWHADMVRGADSKGAVDTIQRLYDLLDKERANNASLQVLLTDANQRTDRANEERNALVREMGEIKAQLAALQAEVRMLREVKNAV